MAFYRNLFNKLLKRDKEKTFQDEGSYWDSKNYRVIQRSDGSFSIQTIDGDRVAFTLDRDNWTVIGSESNSDKRIYLLSTETTDAIGGPGEIGYVELDVQLATFGTYVPIYYHEDLLFTTQHPIADIAIAFVDETTGIKRFYWSDYFNVPRLLNVASTNLARVYSATVAIQYQVVTGTITYGSGSTVYGPGQVAGNVFTGEASYSTWTGTGIVNKHIAVTDLSWTPEKESGFMYCSGYANGGVLLCGAYIAFFTLISADGYSAPYNYHTSPILLGEETPNSGDLKSYQKYQGAQSTISSGKSIILTIDNIDQSFRDIEIVMIRFTGVDTYELPRIYHRSNITGTSMDITIDGQTSLGELTVQQLKSVVNIFKKVGTMEFSKNRMFVADIELTEGVNDWVPGTVGHEWFSYETPSDHVGQKVEGASPLADQSGSLATSATIAPATNSIQVGQWYEVEGDGSNYAIYNGNNYHTTHSPNGAYFQGTFDASSPFYTIRQYTVVGTPTVRAVIRIANFANNYRYYRLDEDFPDMKGIIPSSILASHKRGQEKYRYGIAPLSPEGAPLFVHWIGDWVTPNISDGYPLTSNYIEDDVSVLASGASGRTITNTNHLGLKVGTPGNPLDLTDLVGKVGSVAIVRARRIKKSVAQGLVRYCVPDADDVTRFRAEASQFLYNDRNRRSDTTDNGMIGQVVMFYSPEYQFENYDMSGLYANMEIRISDYLGDPDFPEWYTFALDGAALFGLASTLTYPMHKFTVLGSQYSSYYVKYVESQSAYNASFPLDRVDKVDTIYEVLGAETSLGITGISRNYNSENWSIFWQEPILPATIGSWFASRGKNDKSNILVMTALPNYNHPPVQEGARMLCDILDTDNLDPNYGDTSNTEYQLCGHLLELNDATYAANGNSWKFDGIEVFGGDIYVNLYDTNISVTWTGANPEAGASAAGGGVGVVAVFPVESTINVALRRGRHGMRDGNFIGGVFPEGVVNGQPENFIIDKQYLNDHAVEYTFPGLPKDFIAENTRQNTVFFSDIKILGEQIDNFRVFPALNERFMEISNGAVVALARKDGKVFCFQTEGVLYLPIEEASTVSNDIGEATFIGVGGVIDRFDERSESYGLQDRHHLVSMETGFLWVDINKAKVCYISTSGGVTQLSTRLGMGNFFEDVIRASDLQDNPRGLNPLTGIGITSVYHERFNEAYLTFLTNTSGKESFTIGFNEVHKGFTGEYGWLPTKFIEHNGEVFAQNGRFNVDGSAITDYGTSISVGLTLQKGFKFIHEFNGATVLYRVNTAFTTGVITDPAIVPEISRISDTNEFWHLDSPIQSSLVAGPCRMMGEVQDSRIRIIVNPSNELYKRFDSIKLQGNAGVEDASNDYRVVAYKPDFVSFYTEEHKNELLSTIDWKFRRGEWHANIPKDTRGEGRRRFRGSYLEVEFYHDHNIGKSPITGGEGRYQDSSDQKKIKIVSLFTTFKPSKPYDD
tara:strand:+ start:5917 stop:10323 length:4407 start_codon:yes stop_codon:yes gene_type:complete